MANTPDEEGGVKVPATQSDLDKQRELTERQERVERMKLARERHQMQRDRDLRQLLNRIDEQRKPSFDHLEHTDKSRKHIAFVFVYGYIAIVAIIIVGVPLYNALALHRPDTLELDKTLAQVGALIGSPLGFVVGYYFKEDSRR
jgi:hypothetical protein